jgi:Protein of unknown function (DUF1501)
MNPQSMTQLSRREMLRRCSTGFGLMALSGLFAREGRAALNLPLPHHPRRAKNVIFCYMSGGVSHIDSFDPKPKLRVLAGKPMPVTVERTQFNNNGNVFPSPFEFQRSGRSGIEISSMFPKLREWCADDLAVIRSMTSKVNEHAQGNFVMHSGFPFIGHPSAGAWVSYGLGTENQDVPGFVVLQSGSAVAPHGGVGLFSNGFLPAHHQASIIRVDNAEPVSNIKPREADLVQRERLRFIGALDQRFASATGRDAQVEAAIRNYETAYRMQAAVPELVDLKGETEATKKLYGVDDPHPQKAAYARQCLLARRLVERGVRFVELSCLTENIGAGGAANPWDQHGDLERGHGAMANQVDQPIAGLLVDLKQRGLLEETIVLFAGEFGRTPFSQGSNGRDHNPYGFSVWLAGGGFKGGTIYGATDDLGYHVTENPCTVYDLWATVLHQLGINHEQLTYLYAGRNVRLTDVHGNVLRDVIG